MNNNLFLLQWESLAATVGDGGKHHKLKVVKNVQNVPLFCFIHFRNVYVCMLLYLLYSILKKIQKPERLPLCIKPENMLCLQKLDTSLSFTHR